MKQVNVIFLYAKYNIFYVCLYTFTYIYVFLFAEVKIKKACGVS